MVGVVAVVPPLPVVVFVVEPLVVPVVPADPVEPDSFAPEELPAFDESSPDVGVVVEGTVVDGIVGYVVTT